MRRGPQTGRAHEDQSFATAGVHHAARRRSCVTARGASAAVRNAGDQIHGRGHALGREPWTTISRIMNHCAIAFFGKLSDIQGGLWARR
jgi:hypothetical protein